MNYSVDAGQYTAGSGSYAITRYSILAQKPNGTWEKITATNATYSTGTSKSVNTSGFILNQLRYYGTTTTVASGVKVATNVMYEKAASVDMRYSTNCGATTTWALGDYIYLVGTIGADGLFYLDTTAWWTNTLPSTNDGKLYIRLGLVLTAASYTMSFFGDRPIFYHDGTGIKEYTGIGDGTITITQGGVSKGTFTTNQSGNTTIALDAGGGNPVWGSIGGTLSDQTDLQSALNAKQDLLGGGTSGTLLTNSGTPGTVNATSIDSTPTDGSNNPVSSDGVYTAISIAVANLLSDLYPIGSLYIGTQTTCPLSTLIPGSTWTLVTQDKALWTGDGTNANTTIAAGLPNVTGSFIMGSSSSIIAAYYGNGPFYKNNSTTFYTNALGSQITTEDTMRFDLSRVNSIYGSSSTVQPPAYRVNVWRRTA